MAQLTDLLKAIQPLDGREEATLYNAARKLREDGYLPRGKRGSGAPAVGLPEAVAVLFGVCGNTSVKDAVLRFQVLSDLNLIGQEWVGAPIWPELEDVYRLDAVLTSLLQTLPQLLDFMAGKYCGPDATAEELRSTKALCARGMASIWLEVVFGGHYARIEVKDQASNSYLRGDFIMDIHSPAHHAKQARRGKDRDVSVRIGLPTLLAVALCVLPEAAAQSLRDTLDLSPDGAQGMPVEV